LYKRKLPRERLVTQEFARTLAEISADCGRQVGVLVARSGRVEYVMVGDALSITLPDFKRVRAGAGRFRGLRCIHTHLRGEPLTRDDLTDLTLLRLDAMAAVLVSDAGLPDKVDYASLQPADASGETVTRHDPIAPSQIDFDFLEWIEELEARFGEAQKGVATDGDGERAVLVCVEIGNDPHADERCDEMRELARTAGLSIVDVLRQRRPKPDPKFLIGPGKIKDLVTRAWQRGAEIVLFDRDLSSGQIRAITDLVEARIVDRTQLILDIFAQNAKTKEAKLQVELAQLKYRLPRLAGSGQTEGLSRLMGGIGGRGPGETKLEVDRRRVRDRISLLERGLKEVAKQRETRRGRRSRDGLPVLSIVGYTNAGKSTLLNRLTKSEVYAANKLFATVDTSARRLRTPRERDVIITDTVGFIRDLPPELVAGFKSTLEEIRDATVLLHVVDASSPQIRQQIDAVREILAELDLAEKPELVLLNKSDRLSPEEREGVAKRFGGICISALNGDGIAEMLQAAERMVFERERSAAKETR
jgi:GTP-binding protein HflX